VGLVLQAGKIDSVRSKRNSFPNKKTKIKIRKLYFNRCIKCGKHENEVEPDVHGTRLNIHHIKRYESGGTHAISNLVLMCRFCHIDWHKFEKTCNIPFWTWVEQNI